MHEFLCVYTCNFLWQGTFFVYMPTPKSKIFLCSPFLINLSFWNLNHEWIYIIFLFVIILVLVLLIAFLLFTLFCYSICCSSFFFSYSPPPFCGLIHHVATPLLCSLFMGLIANTFHFCKFVMVLLLALLFMVLLLVLSLTFFFFTIALLLVWCFEFIGPSPFSI
jgi:hypothetical protein